MTRVLIDTNIYSLAMRGAQEVVEILRHTRQIGISAISIGELFSGFRGGSREQQNRQELFQFCDSPRVSIFPVTEDTAEYYGAVLQQLRQQGTPIPTNDIWIAAVAFQHGLPLFTRDEHFAHIQGLLLR
jgi:tRNA(fMet)-specific endonuclease VapC